MSAQSFPLLRLPLVALAEVIKIISLKQLVPLSLCSKRMHFVVKKYRNKSSQLVLNLRSQRDSEINIFYRGFQYSDGLMVRVVSEEFAEGWRTDRIGGTVVKVMETERELVTYWEDLVYGSKSMIDYICHLFGIPVTTVTIAENITWPLDFVEERQGPSSYRAVIGVPGDWATISEENFRHILTNNNPSFIRLNQMPTHRFRIENFNKRYDTFDLVFGNWLTLDNLCTLDCIEIVCSGKRFTEAELNRYFKHVLAGGSPRLKRCRIYVMNGNENVVLDGIQDLLRPIPGKESFSNDDTTWLLQGKLNRGDDSMQVTFKGWREENRIDLLFETCLE